MHKAVTESNEPLTIASALERILYKYMKEGKVTENVFNFEEQKEEEAKPDLEYEKRREETYDYVMSRLDLTRPQVEFFASALDITIDGYSPTIKAIADIMGISSLKLLSMMEEMEALMEKRYIRVGSKGVKGACYEVPDHVIRAIQRNEKPEDIDYSQLSSMGMIRRWNELFSQFFRDNLDINTLRNEVFHLVRNATSNAISKAWSSYGIESLAVDYRILLAYMLTRNVAYSDNEYECRNYSKLFEDEFDEYEIQKSLKDGSCPLFRLGIADFVSNDGMVDNNLICLTDKAKADFLSDAGMSTASECCTCRNMVPSDAIKPKTLFYNAGEGSQIEKLTALLQKESFDSVVSRLEEKGMRKGFCCLLYGGPGTGKTESVYQIARQTGRDVFLVEVSQLKSKWVGDSEKNVRALFDEYRTMVSRRELAPILLFNEADAIFGVRMRGAEKAVDKMENSIQNIILQEMESLEGILIATTNLTSNFDPAFERRFIYKVNLSNPDVQARAHIWESLVSGISEDDAQKLAAEYDFSGGQIENISRKMTVDYVLSGVQPGLDSIRELCNVEKISDSPARSRARIGF